MIYFDYSATTPISKEALEVYMNVSQNFWGNPSSIHDIGGRAAALIENCRHFIAQSLNVSKDGIYFTSGGTESNALAITSLVQGAQKKGRHIITSQAEHASISSTMRFLEQQGYEVTYVPLTSDGQISLQHVQAAVREDTIVVSFQHVNSETGVIQPIEALSQIVRPHNILFHSDTVQSYQKLDVSTIIPFVDSISLSAHKIYGPQGVGVAYIHPSIYWSPMLPTNTQERGFRGGTENVPAIAAFAQAIQPNEHTRYRSALYEEWRALLKDILQPVADRLSFHEHDVFQLPSIVAIRFHHVEGQYVMLECNKHGFAISTGSACQVGKQTPSATMLAMGVSPEDAKGLIRLSFGKDTTEQHIRAIGEVLKQIAL